MKHETFGFIKGVDTTFISSFHKTKSTYSKMIKIAQTCRAKSERLICIFHSTDIKKIKRLLGFHRFIETKGIWGLLIKSTEYRHETVSRAFTPAWEFSQTHRGFVWTGVKFSNSFPTYYSSQIFVIWKEIAEFNYILKN